MQRPTTLHPCWYPEVAHCLLLLLRLQEAELQGMHAACCKHAWATTHRPQLHSMAPRHSQGLTMLRFLPFPFFSRLLTWRLLRRLEEAERRCKAALNVLGDQNGADTPPLADVLMVRGRLLAAQEKLPEAEEDLRRCLRIRCGRHGAAELFGIPEAVQPALNQC